MKMNIHKHINICIHRDINIYMYKRTSWQKFDLHIYKCRFYQKDEKLYMLWTCTLHVLSRAQTTTLNEAS